MWSKAWSWNQVFCCKSGLEEACFQVAANTPEQKHLFRAIIQKVVYKCSGLQNLFRQDIITYTPLSCCCHITIS